MPITTATRVAMAPSLSEMGKVRARIELTDCGSFQSSRRWNGEYRGLGVLLRNATSPSDGSTREDIFYHSLIGPTWFGPFDVGK